MRTRFKNYRILRELSSSLWASVYEAVQEPLDRNVCLKVLNLRSSSAQDNSPDAELVQRFEREAKICANLVHPNIVRLFDYGRWKGKYFIVQEWVEGESLKELLEKGSLPEDTGLYIIKEVTEGLAYAHSQGVVHRDIKPANILIDKNGSVKLADFGLARSIELPDITLEGTLMGTPAYSSPEQLKGSDTDSRSDIFSFGVVFYQTLTGLNPFAADSYTAIIHKVSRTRPLSPHRLNPGVNPSISKLIMSMIAKTPSRRIGDLNQVFDILNQRSTVTRKDVENYLKGNPEAKYHESLPKVKLPVWVYPVLIGAIVVVVLPFALSLFLGSRDPRLHTWQPSDTTTNGGDIVLEENLTQAETTPQGLEILEAQRPTQGFLRFQVKPWAKVWVDGTYWETTPTDRLLTLSAGRHNIRLVHDYLPVREEEVTLDPGETLFVKVDLLKVTGWLSLTVRPWGEVYVDGVHVGTTPISQPIPLHPGQHKLYVKHPSLRGYETTIDLAPGDTLSKMIELSGG